MPGLQLFLLGSPYMERDGKTIDMDTRKAMALISYLALNPGQHNRDSLAALLWPDYDESGARGAFRRTLSTLNKSLGEGILDITREMISLNPSASLWVDVWGFRRCLRAGNHQTPTLADYLEAIKLYRGDFMAGFALRDSITFDDWQFFQAEALRLEFSTALEKLALLQIDRDDFSQAQLSVRHWLSLDPLNEPAHRLLMQLYEWSGQHAAALRQYRECVRILDQQLSVPPLEETTQLYQAIQEQRLPKPHKENPDISPRLTPAAIYPSKTSTPLVGRTDEISHFKEAFSNSGSGGYLMVLQGEAGIGKTRLAQEFLALSEQQGITCISTRCHEGEQLLAFAPLIDTLRSALNLSQTDQRLKLISPEWLTEAGRLVSDPRLPNIPPASTAPLEPGLAHMRFMEGVSQTLLSLCVPGILFIDDIHWADSASINFLTYLARRLAGSRLFLLVSWRNELIPADHMLRRVVTEARREGYAHVLELERLPFPAVLDLVNQMLPNQSEAKSHANLAKQLFQETEGLPYFITEYLVVLHNHPTEDHDQWQIPPNVRDVLLSRLSSVDDAGSQFLTAAAVLGRSFEFDLLRHVSGRSELETVSGLEKLIEAGLIHEQPQSGVHGELMYDFAHEKLRQLVYESASLARRRLLHVRAAESLIPRSRQIPRVAALVAQHYQLAGQNTAAAEYYQQAGVAARAVYANRESINLFQNALACGHTKPADLHEAIGDLHTLSGEYQAALTSYETAAALCSPERIGRLEHRLGNVRSQRGEWELAECHFESAVQALAEQSAENAWAVGEQARVYSDWSRVVYRRGNFEQAQTLAGHALELARAAENQPALAQAHNMLGLLARRRQDFSQALLHLQQSLEMTTRSQDIAGQAAALNNLARVQADCGELSKAIDLTRQALAICQRLGDRHRAAALQNNLADLYHAAGDSQSTMQHLKQAVSLFAEIGSQADVPLPEIWMLSEW